jgi:simple sugar transport system permease protein
MRAEHTFGKLAIPGLSDLPIIGPVVFKQDVLVYISYVLVAATAFYLYKTRAGLFLRALGENPAAIDSVGVNVFRLRYLYVMIGGALAGLGGAYLSLAYAPCWLENMTAGRGWIAVALVIFAIWDPWRALAGSYLFGGVDALGFHLQVIGLPVSIFILNMLPYIFTILVLILVLIRKGGRLASPQALGVPYDREER